MEKQIYIFDSVLLPTELLPSLRDQCHENATENGRLAAWGSGRGNEQAVYKRNSLLFIIRSAKVSRKAAFFFTLAYHTKSMRYFKYRIKNINKNLWLVLAIQIN